MKQITLKLDLYEYKQVESSCKLAAEKLQLDQEEVESGSGVEHQCAIAFRHTSLASRVRWYNLYIEKAFFLRSYSQNKKTNGL